MRPAGRAGGFQQKLTRRLIYYINQLLSVKYLLEASGTSIITRPQHQPATGAVMVAGEFAVVRAEGRFTVAPGRGVKTIELAV
jgi:hypothetical protein